VFIYAINPLRRGINFMEGIMKKEEKKEVRAIQYEATQEMADILRRISDLGAEITCEITPALGTLGNYVIEHMNVEDMFHDEVSGWYSAHKAVIEKLEKISNYIEIESRSIGLNMDKAIEAVHGKDEREDAIYKKDTPEVFDQLSILLLRARELSETVSWRIDKERKAQTEAA